MSWKTGATSEAQSEDMVFTTTNMAAGRAKLHNPKESTVLINSASSYDRTSKTNGVIIRVVFPRGSLPRGGEFRWKPPDYAEVREGDGQIVYDRAQGGDAHGK